MARERKRVITALDIGTTKVCAMIAEAGGGSLDIIGVGVSHNEGMKKGLVVDLEKVEQAVYRAVSDAERMSGTGVDKVYIGVSGSHIGSNSAHGMAIVQDQRRGITEEDVTRCVESARVLLLPPDKEIVDIVVQEFLVDGHGGVCDPIGMAGSRLEARVQIITGASSFLQNIIRCVLKLDITVAGLLLEPLASGEAVLSEDEKQIGVVLLDIGGGTMDMAVFRDGSLCRARILPVGGNHIDNDVAVGLSTSLREAERLKIEHGRAFLSGVDESVPIDIQPIGQEKRVQRPKGLLCEIIQARVMEMVRLVFRELEESEATAIVPGGVVITGGGALLEGFAEIASRLLDMHVRVGHPRYAGAHREMVTSPIFATAVGMLQYAERRVQSGWVEEMPRRGGLQRFVKNIAGISKVFLP
ncbi:MAG: cell division protein FtsA [bacterium]